MKLSAIYFLFIFFFAVLAKSSQSSNSTTNSRSHSGVYQLNYQTFFDKTNAIRIEANVNYGNGSDKALGQIKFVRSFPLNFDYDTTDTVKTFHYNCNETSKDKISCDLRDIPADPCLETRYQGPNDGSRPLDWSLDYYTNVKMDLSTQELKAEKTTFECSTNRYGSISKHILTYDYLYNHEEQLACTDQNKNLLSFKAPNGLTYFADKYPADTNNYAGYRISACKNNSYYQPFGRGGWVTGMNQRTVWCGGDRTYIFDEFLNFTSDENGNAILWGLDRFPGYIGSSCNDGGPPEVSLKAIRMTDKFKYDHRVISLPNSDKIGSVAIIRLVDSKTLTVRIKIDYKTFGVRTYDVSPDNPPREVIE
jgi:hypothetical protein